MTTRRLAKAIAVSLIGLSGVLVLPASTAFSQQQADLRFDIKRYDVSGDTILGSESISNLLAPYTGNGKTLADVQAARAALQKAYLDKGIKEVLVVLPKQEMEKGMIRLAVIRATLGKISVSGNKHSSTQKIHNSLPALAEGKPLNPDAIAASIKLSNENPSRQSAVVLKPGDKEGVLDAEVRVVDEKPWKAYVTLDNSGNDATGKHRLSVGYQNSNILDRDHVLTMQYTTSPQKASSVSIWGASYQIPLFQYGDSVSVFGGYSDVDSGVIADVFNVSGKGSTLGVRYNQNLTRRGLYEHKVVYGADYRAYKQDITFAGATQLGTDITLTPLSVGYAGSWREAGKFDAGFNVSGHANVPTGGKGDSQTFDRARLNANADYKLLRYGANYARALPNDWSVRAALSGQYASEELVNPEQFGLGGADGVRGFNEREVVDDKGYRGTLEVYTPDFASKLGMGFGPDFRSRAVVFYDFGTVERVRPLAGERLSESVASAGVGLRIGYGKRVNLKLDFAQVLNDGGAKRVNDQALHAALLLLW